MAYYLLHVTRPDDGRREEPMEFFVVVETDLDPEISRERFGEDVLRPWLENPFTTVFYGELDAMAELPGLPVNTRMVPER